MRNGDRKGGARTNDRARAKGTMKRFGRRALDYVFPKKCALCGEVMGLYDEGELCAPCLAAYSKRLGERCPSCGRDAISCVCSRLRTANIGAGVTALGFYKTSGDEVGRLVYSFKRTYQRDLTRFFARSLAAQMMRAVGRGFSGAVVAFPPRSPEAVRRYGFDHARRLAHEVARYLGAEFMPALRRVGGDEQKTLDAARRAENVSGAFAVDRRYADSVAGRDVILVDDVATTGATLAEAGKAICAAGAASVRYAVLFVAADKPERASTGIWFEDGDEAADDGDPLADDVGF